MTCREADLRRTAQAIIAPYLAEANVVSLARAGGFVAIHLNVFPDWFIVGQKVFVSGVTPTQYNGEKTITSINAGTKTFSFAQADAGAYVSGGTVTSRVRLGRVQQTESEDVFGTLDVAPYAVVLPARNGGYNGQTRHFEILISTELHFGSAGDTSPDFTAYEEKWTAIRDAFIDEANWPRSPFDRMDITGPICLSDVKPSHEKYVIDLTFLG